ncbi:MAG: sulfur relay protein DsrC [Acidiferrobacteraceae bacterium]|nr:sulfur relay protein DsrC [Acidiferrobacteraceae bacterium]
MKMEFDSQTVETTETGYLVNIEDWSEALGNQIAESEGLVLTALHWDLINYLRDEYLNNAGSQPNDRNLNKAMSAQWGRKVSSKELYDLFPGKPSKQARLIGGLPESRRKGGY